MKSDRIAKRYANALFSLALDEKKLDAVHTDFSKLLHVIEESPEFCQFLSNPIVPIGKQKGVLTHLFGKEFQKITLNFLLFLADQEKIRALPSICQFFEKLIFDYHNKLKVKIISAVSLQGKQVRALCDKLKKFYKRDIESTQEVDPDIVGGFKIVVGSKVYDMSLLTQLQIFKGAVLTA